MSLHYNVILLFSLLCKSITVQTSNNHELTIEPIQYGSENHFPVGVRRSIICKGVNKNQKVEWVDPSGRVVPRHGRVYAQQHFVPSLRARPALVLTITSTSAADTGLWTCRSGDVHRAVPVCVIEPAEFVSSDAISADPGRAITLTCQASGDPEPRIVWYRNGDIILDGTNPTKYKVLQKFSDKGFEGLLTITGLSTLDSGVYTCGSVQENPVLPECALTKYINVTLHVNYAPLFDVENETALVPGKENESVDLVCAANGYPTPLYRWFKDNGAVLTELKNETQSNQEKSTLTVTADESTYGQRYVCRASNQYGAAEKTFEIYKMASPEKPTDITVENASENEMAIKITWKELVKFPIDEIQVQYAECGEDDESAEEDEFSDAKSITINDVEFTKAAESFESSVLAVLTELREETEYCVRVRASNEAGTSPWSEVVVASTSKLLVEALEERKIVDIVAVQTNTTFYGIFFAGALCIVAVAYMFMIRLV